MVLWLTMGEYRETYQSAAVHMSVGSSVQIIYHTNLEKVLYFGLFLTKSQLNINTNYTQDTYSNSSALCSRWLQVDHSRNLVEICINPGSQVIDFYHWNGCRPASQFLIQSCISSGISWGFRIPGTDIWIRRFSSCACRNAVSRSSRNRSESSSPVYSWGKTKKVKTY